MLRMVPLPAPGRSLILRGDADPESVQFGAELDLARQAAVRAPVDRAVEQVVLVAVHRLERSQPFRIDMDMAGRAAAAAATQGEQLLEAGVADILHHRPAGLALDALVGAVAADDDKLCHKPLDAGLFGRCL